MWQKQLDVFLKLWNRSESYGDFGFICYWILINQLQKLKIESGKSRYKYIKSYGYRIDGVYIQFFISLLLDLRYNFSYGKLKLKLAHAVKSCRGKPHSFNLSLCLFHLISVSLSFFLSFSLFTSLSFFCLGLFSIYCFEYLVASLLFHFLKLQEIRIM